MFNITDIMTTNVAYVTKKTPIDQVLEILIEKNITGIPVVNEDMTLAGIVTEKDVLELLHSDSEDLCNAEDFMSTEVVSFDRDDDLIAVCECLVKNHFRRVPIVYDGKLVGIVSRRDIIKYILEPI